MYQKAGAENAGDNVFSPLQRLQTEIAKDKGYPFTQDEPSIESSPDKRKRGGDNESIYSFDSVSTSGRLLDRLDLDADEYINEYEVCHRRRDSVLSNHNTGRSGELSLNESSGGSNQDLRQVPIRGNSTLGLDRKRSINSNRSPARNDSSRSFSSSGKLPVQAVAGQASIHNRQRSFDSLKADTVYWQNSSSSVSSMTDSALTSRQNSSTRLAQSRSSQKLLVHSPIPESSSEFSSPGSSKVAAFTPVTPPKSIESGKSTTTSTPVLGPPGGVSGPTVGVLGPTVGASGPTAGVPRPHSGPYPLPYLAPVSAGRTISSSSNESATSFDAATAFIQSSLTKFDPLIDAATKKAVSIRSEGNHREASYQLQTLANPPNNYPKAMYLYAKALGLGQGVKLNYSQSVRWLCRCILTSYIAENSAPDSRAFTAYISKLADFSPETLLDMVKMNLATENNSPYILMDSFQTLGQSTLNRIVHLNSGDKNIVGSAYYLLSEYLITGQGVPSKDEVTARCLLAKSASCAYVDAMSKLGELWCIKSKHFRKDLYIASAWLRLAEFFGKRDIGNSWIYKSKYMDLRKGK